MCPRSAPLISADAVPGRSKPESRSKFRTAVRLGELISVGPLNEYRMIARAMRASVSEGLPTRRTKAAHHHNLVGSSWGPCRPTWECPGVPQEFTSGAAKPNSASCSACASTRNEGVPGSSPGVGSVRSPAPAGFLHSGRGAPAARWHLGGNRAAEGPQRVRLGEPDLEGDDRDDHRDHGDKHPDQGDKALVVLNPAPPV
jgi:hypothetical protein